MKLFILTSLISSCTLLSMNTPDTLKQLNTIIAQGSREAFDQNLEVFRTTLSYLDLQGAYHDCNQQLKQLNKETTPGQVNPKRDNTLYMTQTLRNIIKHRI